MKYTLFLTLALLAACGSRKDAVREMQPDVDIYAGFDFDAALPIGLAHFDRPEDSIVTIETDIAVREILFKQGTVQVGVAVFVAQGSAERLHKVMEDYLRSHGTDRWSNRVGGGVEIGHVNWVPREGPSHILAFARRNVGFWLRRADDPSETVNLQNIAGDLDDALAGKKTYTDLKASGLAPVISRFAMQDGSAEVKAFGFKRLTVKVTDAESTDQQIHLRFPASELHVVAPVGGSYAIIAGAAGEAPISVYAANRRLLVDFAEFNIRIVE